VVREHVDTRWQDPDKLMPPSAKTREGTHSRVVRDVAQQRLAFPNEEFPSLRTHVNVPRPALVIRSAEGAELVPDIVVAESPGNRPRILAAVETVDTVTDEQARARWLPFAQVPDTTFYLYVPSGFAAEARGLLKKHRIKGAAARLALRHRAGHARHADTDYGGILSSLPRSDATAATRGHAGRSMLRLPRIGLRISFSRLRWRCASSAQEQR
jgi:hypothetical protein